ncbi:MAG: PQQ-dependent sugar dehydrogenase [Bacteroidetes bacterium]|nr:PQQ-dependent sugar dehydrogenase [Bacteroidota bacterium]
MSNSIKLLWMVLISGIVSAQTPQLNTIPFISGLVKPVDITHCNDSRLFIVEQDGRIRVVLNDTLLSTPFLDINPQVLSTGNEQGLLGLAFHPDYKTNGHFYVNYINNSGHTRIARFSVDPLDSNRALISSEIVLMTINQPYSNHNGGDLMFGNDGYLYIPMGDGGNANDPQNHSQNTLDRLGKTLRIDVNHGNLFAIPPDNPFLNNIAYLPEIWNSGLRNPWKASFDKLSGGFWIGDVGQNVWEEINYQDASSPGGENYGWRCYEASVAFNLTGCQAPSAFTMPVHEYAHANGNCSVTGGEVYRGSKYANLFGHYLFSDFCVPSIRTIKKTGNQFIHATNNSWTGAGISCFGQDFRGELYVANLYNGQVRKIADTSSCIPVAWLADEDTIQLCGNSATLKTPFGDSLFYSWYFNGAQVPGNTSNELSISQSGTYIVSVDGTQGICRNSDTVHVVLSGSSPIVSISGLDTNYCQNQSTAILTGNPSGGTFSGLGVNGNTFSPGQAGLGTILVQYSFTDNNGCTVKNIQATKVLSCAGLNEAETDYITSMYPNPSNEKLTLKLNNHSGSDLMLNVFDVFGQLIHTDNTSVRSSSNEFTLSTQSYPQGTYLLKLSDPFGFVSTKLFTIIH